MGATVDSALRLLFSDSLSLSYENNTTRGYLSSVAPEMTIGIGQRSMIDSIVVIWSGGNYQKIKNGYK